MKEHGEAETLLRTVRERAEALGRSENPAREFRELGESIKGMTDHFARISAESHEGADETGLVAATLTGDGALQKMDISARAMRDLSSDDLGAACLAAIRSARAKAAEAFQEASPPPSGEVLEPQEILRTMMKQLGGTV